ncbi:MAG: leucyl/phenylalanyl-tRNA--protein transferase [Muribaculaceae bacterium]|nr:leucyl/phenylalanyl-tRNA--protein transferase [Muribaculaceae bacterium]
MVFELGEDIVFPDPRLGEENGLLAVGGDLSVDRLLLAYSFGIFPWYSFRDWPCPAWYCPLKRFVIFPDEIHVSHSMRTLMNKRQYRVTFDQDFEGVIKGCGEVDGRYYHTGAWLGEDISNAYTDMHVLGYAHSVEVWNADNELAGGLYGIIVGDCFIGESMFSREPNTSKLALIHLARFMQSKGGRMIDCQLETAHLRSMGGHFISYEEYLEILNPQGLKDLNMMSADTQNADNSASYEDDEKDE